MKRILVIGKSGQVGWELTRTLQPIGRVTAVDYPEIDLASSDSIRSSIRAYHPDIIVNAAAYTAVDRAEEEESLAMAINGEAPAVIAEEAKASGAYFVHYSTEYVFDGVSECPYREEDEPNPLGVYGRSKLAGERAIASVDHPALILRTSWVYGSRGHNFLLTMLRLAEERDSLRIVDDQIGAPTWSRMLAQATAQLLPQAVKEQRSGLYHLASAGETSWYGFAREILKERNVSVEPITTDQFPTAAQRPKNSRLQQEKVQRDFGVAMPDWRVGLELCSSDMFERLSNQPCKL